VWSARVVHFPSTRHHRSKSKNPGDGPKFRSGPLRARTGVEPKEAVRFGAEFKRAIELSGSNDIFLASLGRAYAAQESNIALIYVALGSDDEAMVWLEKAYHERFNPSILLRPAFDSLRSDARFQDLLRRIGLPAVLGQSSKPPSLG
jgi:hypothetical protein